MADRGAPRVTCDTSRRSHSPRAFWIPGLRSLQVLAALLQFLRFKFISTKSGTVVGIRVRFQEYMQMIIWTMMCIISVPCKKEALAMCTVLQLIQRKIVQIHNKIKYKGSKILSLKYRVSTDTGNAGIILLSLKMYYCWHLNLHNFVYCFCVPLVIEFE